jgi:hypothetical protein
MTYKEIQKSIESHDRQLNALISWLADFSERLDKQEKNIDGLVRLAEIQNERLTRLEDKILGSEN